MRDDQTSALALVDHPICTRATCGAKTRAGTPCRGRAMRNGRCRLHGVISLAVIASPSFKTGRYSKVMPISLREGYERGRSDPELLSLVDEIALVQGRLRQLIGRLEADNGPIVRHADLVRTWAALTTAQRRRDPVAVAAAIDAHGAAIEAASANAVADSAVWTEIRETTRLAATLMNQEAQRRIAMGDLVNTEV